MLNIDQLKYDYIIKPIFSDLKEMIDDNNPNITIWYKNYRWYFEFNKETGILNYQYGRVHVFLRERYNIIDRETVFKVKKLMEEHYNLKNIIIANRTSYLDSSYKNKEIHIEGNDIKLEFCKWFFNRIKRKIVNIFK